MKPPTQSVSGPHRLLWVSVGLNLVLLAALLFFRPAPPRAASPESIGRSGTPREVASQSTRPGATRFRSRAPEVETKVPTPWSRLVSADLREYAHNLRLAGCPSETVCDLVRTEGKRRLAAQTVAAYGQADFWLAGARRSAHRENATAQEHRRQQEQTELLQELGCAVEWPDDDDFRTDLIVAVVGGFLRPEQRRELVNLTAVSIRFQEQWRERTRGVVLPADLRWLADEGRNHEARLQRTVSAAEFEEVCLRLTAVLEVLAVADETAATVGLTPAEFRELHRLGFAGGENELEQVLHWKPNLPSGARPSRSEEQRETDFRAVLGDSRAEALLVRASPTFSTTEEWTKTFGLDSTTSQQVFAELRHFQRTVADLAAAGREQPDSVKADFLAAHAAAQARLEQSLRRVPETNRVGQIRNWLDRATVEGWGRP